MDMQTPILEVPPKIRRDPIMTFHKIMQIAEQPARADKSALGAINRPLRMFRYPNSFVHLHNRVPTNDIRYK